MNPYPDDHVPPFDDPAREREWLAQEYALQHERLQLDRAGDDRRSRSYRLLTRTLREPPSETLPADFARHVAARAAAMPIRPIVAESRFESGLMLVLAVAAIVAAGTIVAIYGGTWLPAFHAILPAPQASVNGWLLTLGGCLGASWLLGQWQQHVSGKQAR